MATWVTRGPSGLLLPRSHSVPAGMSGSIRVDVAFDYRGPAGQAELDLLMEDQAARDAVSLAESGTFLAYGMNATLLWAGGHFTPGTYTAEAQLWKTSPGSLELIASATHTVTIT